MGKRRTCTIFISELIPRYCPGCGESLGEPSTFFAMYFLKGDRLAACRCGISFQYLPEAAINGISEAWAELSKAGAPDNVTAAAALITGLAEAAR